MKRWLLIVMLAHVACLPRAPLYRLPQAEKVVVAYVFDAETTPQVTSVSPLLKTQVETELSARNFQVREWPLEKLSPSFASVKDSKSRFELLRKKAHAFGAYVLLVETRASFFSQLNGRYRYLVSIRLTGGRADGTVDPLQWSFEQPTYTNFDNERETDAVEAARAFVATKAGQLFEEFLHMVPLDKSTQRLTPKVPGPMYFVLVDRFWNGDPQNDGDKNLQDASAFHGGDLQGVIDKLDSLQSMGIKTLWLSPVFKMRTQKFFGHGAFHGYWVDDLSQVEPRFGTTQLLVKLADELRRRDMGLVLDMVFNHVAPDSAWLKEKPSWFHHQGPISDWKNETQLTQNDVHGLPDLAVENEEVYRYLMDISVRWVQLLRPVGFRMDAVKHIPLSFWARFNEDLKSRISQPLVILGEMYDGSPAVQARIQNAGKFDAMFDFPLYFALVEVFCKQATPWRLASVLSQDRLYERPDALVTFADNHDVSRIMSDCGGATDSVAQLLTFQLLTRGTPNLTYGTEYGLSGTSEPENRGDFSPNASMLKSHITKVLSVRALHPALQDGVMWVHSVGKNWVMFGRAVEKEVAFIAVNHHSQPQQISLPADLRAEEVVDAFSNAPLARSTFNVLPKAVRVLTVKVTSRQWYDLARERQKALKKRTVEVKTPSALVGAGPELGEWNLDKALWPNVQGKIVAEFPVGAVLEMKLALGNKEKGLKFEEGENRFLFVPEGKDSLSVSLVEE